MRPGIAARTLKSSTAMDRRKRRPGRILAPIAILIALGALFFVVTGSEVEQAEKGKNTDLSGETTTGKRGGRRRRGGSGRLPSRVYVVKSGDSPQGIADKVGVPIEKLRRLNPDALGDAQTLVVGARIKLR